MGQQISIVAAGLSAWVLGAFWYGLFASQWVKASKVDPKLIGKGHPALPHAIGLGGAMISSAMMAHVFGLCGIAGDPMHGLKSGLGMGACLSLPWIANTVLYGGRDMNLIWLDGGYPVLAMGTIGLVLNLF